MTPGTPAAGLLAGSPPTSSGLPVPNRTHKVAQAAAPRSRIVYADNDPLVLAHARALLIGTRLSTVEYMRADLRDPHAGLAEAAGTLDLFRPVAVLLLAILHFITDDEDPAGIVAALVTPGRP